MQHAVWAIYARPAYMLPSSVELQIRDPDGILMPMGRVWKSVSTHRAQEKLQT